MTHTKRVEKEHSMEGFMVIKSTIPSWGTLRCPQTWQLKTRLPSSAILCALSEASGPIPPKKTPPKWSQILRNPLLNSGFLGVFDVRAVRRMGPQYMSSHGVAEDQFLPFEVPPLTATIPSVWCQARCDRFPDFLRYPGFLQMGSQDWSVLPRFRLSFSQFSWFNSQEKTVLISRRSFPSPDILFWFNSQDFPRKTQHLICHSQKDSPSRPFSHWENAQKTSSTPQIKFRISPLTGTNIPAAWLGTPLVGGFNLPLWKMMEFVSWEDDIPNIWKNQVRICKGYSQGRQLWRFFLTIFGVFYQISPPWGAYKMGYPPVITSASARSSGSLPAPRRRSVRRIGATSVPPRRSSPRMLQGVLAWFLAWSTRNLTFPNNNQAVQKWGTRVDLVFCKVEFFLRNTTEQCSRTKTSFHEILVLVKKWIPVHWMRIPNIHITLYIYI